MCKSLTNYFPRDNDFLVTYFGKTQKLLAATCMLLTAIGEGINRIKRSLPEFLESTYPDIPWKAIVGMRNHIAHGYFELDAEIVYETVSTNIPSLHDAIKEAISELKH